MRKIALIIPFLIFSLNIFSQCVAPTKRDTYNLSMFRQAQSNLDNGANIIYDVIFIGNSITEGVYLGTLQQIHDSSYVGRLKTYFNNKYSDVGDGVQLFTYAFENPQYAFYGNWYTAGTFGYGFAETYKYTVGDKNAYFTCNFKGTGCDLIGNFKMDCKVSVDGGAYTPVATSFFTRNLYNLPICSGLANTTHTISVKHDDSTGMMGLASVFITGPGNRGFRFNNMAIAGTTLTKDDVPRTLTGYRYLNPVLTVICSVTNEYFTHMDTNVYRTHLISVANNALLTGDCIFLCNLLRQDVPKSGMDPYVRTMKRTAAELNIRCIDIYTKWNQHGVELGFMHDAVHPNARGDNDIFQEIMKVLEP